MEGLGFPPAHAGATAGEATKRQLQSGEVQVSGTAGKMRPVGEPSPVERAGTPPDSEATTGVTAGLNIGAIRQPEGGVPVGAATVIPPANLEITSVATARQGTMGGKPRTFRGGAHAGLEDRHVLPRVHRGAHSAGTIHTGRGKATQDVRGAIQRGQIILNLLHPPTRSVAGQLVIEGRQGTWPITLVQVVQGAVVLVSRASVDNPLASIHPRHRGALGVDRKDAIGGVGAGAGCW